MKRAAVYARVSSVDQHPETQLRDLDQFVADRNLEVVETYVDHASGAKARRPGLDRLMADARSGKFRAVVVWSTDRLARSTKHFLETLDELNHLEIELLSFREQFDTGGPLGRAVATFISMVAELERSLIVERVKAGMRRAKLEGRKMGRPKKIVDVKAVLADRTAGMSLQQLAKAHHVSKATIGRLLRENGAVSKGSPNPPPQIVESAQLETVT